MVATLLSISYLLKALRKEERLLIYLSINNYERTPTTSSIMTKRDTYLILKEGSHSTYVVYFTVLIHILKRRGRGLGSQKRALQESPSLSLQSYTLEEGGWLWRN